MRVVAKFHGCEASASSRAGANQRRVASACGVVSVSMFVAVFAPSIESAKLQISVLVMAQKETPAALRESDEGEDSTTTEERGLRERIGQRPDLRVRRGVGCGRPGDDNPSVLRESGRRQDASANGARFGEGLPPGSIAERQTSAVNVIVNRLGVAASVKVPILPVRASPGSP